MDINFPSPIVEVDLTGNEHHRRILIPEMRYFVFEISSWTTNTAFHQAAFLADLKDIYIFPVALSDHTTTTTMALHPKNTGENSLKTAYPSSNEKVSVQVVDAGSIFAQIGLSYIDIIKIDTEGCEVEILQSLKRYIPYIGMLMIRIYSEADRRKIDQLLPEHLMAKAMITDMHLGTVRYVNSKLINTSFSTPVKDRE